MSAVAIIPARAGSRRIFRKNIRPFHGKPVIAYSIEAAQASRLFSRIVVTTDDNTIGLIAEGYGADAYLRPDHLALDEVGTQEVTRDVLVWLEEQGDLPAYACCIYACAPLITADDLREAYQSAYEHPFNYVYAEGQFYFGVSRRFINCPNDFSHSKRMESDRYIDVNTEEDWQRAEQMYAALEEK